MTIKAMQAAKKICELGDWKITNLKLQKLLYFSHVAFLGKYEKLLIEEDFYAWQFGPVIKDLYYELKDCGRNPIGESIFDGINDLKDGEEADTLKSVFDVFGETSVSDLIAFSHVKGGAWDRNYDKDKGPSPDITISKDDIIKEYDRIIKTK